MNEVTINAYAFDEVYSKTFAENLFGFRWVIHE
jgi:hypothetical protein